MVRVAPRLSEAHAVASASVSCARRDRRRTTRPEAINGAAMSGMATSTKADSLGLLYAIRATAPMNMKRVRKAIDADEPNAALICVVSAVRRDTSSPVRALSQNE